MSDYGEIDEQEDEDEDCLDNVARTVVAARAQQAARTAKTRAKQEQQMQLAVSARQLTVLRDLLPGLRTCHSLGIADLAAIEALCADMQSDAVLPAALKRNFNFSHPSKSRLVRVPELLLTPLGSGVVRFTGGLVVKYGVDIPRLCPASMSPVLGSFVEAVDIHDDMVLPKDTLRRNPQNFLGLSHLCVTDLEAKYREEHQAHNTRCEDAGVRRDQIYIALPHHQTIQVCAGCPFHRSFDDAVRDLDRDLSGQSYFVALGSLGSVFNPMLDMPPPVARLWVDHPSLRAVVFAHMTCNLPIGKRFW